MGLFRITRLFGGIAHGERVPAWFTEGNSVFSRTGVGATLYELRSYEFGSDTYEVWTDAEVTDLNASYPAQWHARVMRDVSIEKQREIVTVAMDAASRYTNVIMVAGYAALFALWSQMRATFTPLTSLTIAILLAVSVSLFVALEILGMVIRSYSFNKVVKLVDGDSDQFAAGLSSHQQRLKNAASRIIPFQMTAMWTAIATGALAFVVTVSALVHAALVVARGCS